MPEVDASEDVQGGKAEKKKKGNKWIKCYGSSPAPISENLTHFFHRKLP